MNSVNEQKLAKKAGKNEAEVEEVEEDELLEEDEEIIEGEEELEEDFESEEDIIENLKEMDGEE